MLYRCGNSKLHTPPLEEHTEMFCLCNAKNNVFMYPTQKLKKSESLDQSKNIKNK